MCSIIWVSCIGHHMNKSSFHVLSCCPCFVFLSIQFNTWPSTFSFLQSSLTPWPFTLSQDRQTSARTFQFHSFQFSGRQSKTFQLVFSTKLNFKVLIKFYDGTSVFILFLSYQIHRSWILKIFVIGNGHQWWLIIIHTWGTSMLITDVCDTLFILVTKFNLSPKSMDLIFDNKIIHVWLNNMGPSVIQILYCRNYDLDCHKLNKNQVVN